VQPQALQFTPASDPDSTSAGLSHHRWGPAAGLADRAAAAGCDHCRSQLLTVITTLRQPGCDVWQFLEQTWIAYHCGGVMPSLLQGP